MPTTLHTHELIRRLKEFREDQHLSLQNISDMLDAENCHIGMSTLKKVFSEGSEDQRFRFHDTLQPISRVLLGIYSDDDADAEVSALKEAIRVKDELITKLERELAECRIESARKNAFLMHQIELKDERIDKLMARVDVFMEQLRVLAARCDNCPAHKP